MNCDVLVMGSGLAGLVAARVAQQAGATVHVVDPAATPPGCNNSRIASGIFHIAFADPYSDPEQLVTRIMEVTAGSARPELARALVTAAPRTMEWLQKNGFRFIRYGPHKEWAAEPTGMERRGFSWQGLGMDRYLTGLYEAFARAGGHFHTEARVVDLQRQGESGLMVTVESAGGGRDKVPAATVVLADGGFQANQEMVAQYISPAPQRLKLRAAGGGQGDGIRLAQALGAQTVEMAYFYGHLQHQESMEADALWPYPMLDALAVSGIIVDGAGQRVVDEGGGPVFIANSLARRRDPQDTWVLFDSAIWNGPGREMHPVPANPYLEKAGATFWQGETIAGLARQMGIEPARLETTVGEYNKAVQAEKSILLPVPRTASEYRPYPLLEGPFYALPVVPGITNTMGGLLVSPRAEVLDGAERPLPGLFAAGATMGGLDGGPRAGYLGGLMEAAVFGLLAGQAAADDSLLIASREQRR